MHKNLLQSKLEQRCCYHLSPGLVQPVRHGAVQDVGGSGERDHQAAVALPAPLPVLQRLRGPAALPPWAARATGKHCRQQQLLEGGLSENPVLELI